MTRNKNPGIRRPRGWTPDIGGAGKVHVRHMDGSLVVAQLVLLPADNGGRLNVLRCEHYADRSLADAAPVDTDFWRWLEGWANEPSSFTLIIESLGRPVHEGEGPIPMRLFPDGMPEALKRRRKPDAFYVKVAGYVRLCLEHGIAYGPRLARDNGVSEGTVRSWAHEARRRHLLEEEGV